MSTTCKQRATTHNATQTEHPHWKNLFFLFKVLFLHQQLSRSAFTETWPQRGSRRSLERNCLNKELCYVVDFDIRFQISSSPRRGKSDDSLCIHIHLCVALLCLNLTFLVNDSLASLGVHGLCVATAAATHYSLLCTLTWFSMEGFHLYLLIIRVFNIHVNRYLLKLSLVGWGECSKSTVKTSMIRLGVISEKWNSFTQLHMVLSSLISSELEGSLDLFSFHSCI